VEVRSGGDCDFPAPVYKGSKVARHVLPKHILNGLLKLKAHLFCFKLAMAFCPTPRWLYWKHITDASCWNSPSAKKPTCRFRGSYTQHKLCIQHATSHSMLPSKESYNKTISISCIWRMETNLSKKARPLLSDQIAIACRDSISLLASLDLDPDDPTQSGRPIRSDRSMTKSRFRRSFAGCLGSR